MEENVPLDVKNQLITFHKSPFSEISFVFPKRNSLSITIRWGHKLRDSVRIE